MHYLGYRPTTDLGLLIFHQIILFLALQATHNWIRHRCKQKKMRPLMLLDFLAEEIRHQEADMQLQQVNTKTRYNTTDKELIKLWDN